MIEISLDEAMRCLQIFQEQQPENGYVYQCFNLGISALKTILDMQQNGNYTPAPSQNVSRETLTEIANYDCGKESCVGCKFYANEDIGCISNRVKELLKREEIESWIMTHYKSLPKHSDN